MKNDKQQNNLFKFIFCWIIFIVFTTSVWIFKNNLPPSWDEANYLGASEILHQTLTDKGLFAFVANTTTILGTKAPLITILPIPLYLLFGSTFHVAMMVNIIFALLFFFFFYKLVHLIFDEKIAIVSSITVSTMPLFYGLARYYLVEFGLAALVVMWIFFALRTEELTNKRWLILLGVASGLGVMMKFHFILFVAGPALVIFIESWTKLRSKLFDLKNLISFLIPAIVIAFPWYARNILTVLWKAKRSINPELLGNLYYGPPLSFKNIYFSSLDFINYSLSGYWFLVLISLFVLFVYNKKKLKVNFLLFSWFFIPFSVFYLGPNKDYRLMLPLLPPIAIFIAYLLKQTFQKQYFVIFVIMAVFPVLVYLNTSVFNAKVIKNNIALGAIVLADKKIGNYVQVPSVGKWPVGETLKFINGYNKTTANKIVISASETEEFNINTLQYYSLLSKLPLQIYTASYFPKGTNYETIRGTIDKGDYLLMKVGGAPAPSDLNRFNELILQNLDTNTWIIISNNINMPDGGKIKIWQKIS